MDCCWFLTCMKQWYSVPMLFYCWVECPSHRINNFIKIESDMWWNDWCTDTWVVITLVLWNIRVYHGLMLTKYLVDGCLSDDGYSADDRKIFGPTISNFFQFDKTRQLAYADIFLPCLLSSPPLEGQWISTWHSHYRSHRRIRMQPCSTGYPNR